MDVSYKFSVGDTVVEFATGISGQVVTCGIDDIDVAYEVEFDVRIRGRRRHWKREREIRAMPKSRRKPNQAKK